MDGPRRLLRTLNWVRVSAVSALLVAALVVEVFFSPGRPLAPLYTLAVVVYGAIIVYATLDRFVAGSRAYAAVQVGGDLLVIGAFVVATGGGSSPLSFLFVLPVMLAAAVWGIRAAAATAGIAFCLWGAMLALDLGSLPRGELAPGQVAYALASHLVGFVVVGVLGGWLADRLRATSAELAIERDTLEELRAQHEQIVESINTGLLATDGDGRVVFVNRAAAEILKLDGAVVRGRALVELFHLAPQALAEIEASLAAGRRARFERPWTRPADGEELLLGFAFTTLRGRGGSPSGWLVVFQDLTEIASLEAQVRTRERMAALGEMAAGMAHELRNPLSAISGCVQLLAGSPGAAVAEREPLIDVALRESARLDRIIRDFLEFARPGPFRPRPVDLVQLCEELSRLMRKSPGFTPRHRIEVVRGPGTGVVMADPDRMRQVFWNLAGNALKAMPAGGTVTIEVAGVGGDEVELSFHDDGEGMDEETAARLFQPFHGRFREGAGLGGAIVYRIAEEHGGHVQVVSRPGKGTTIRIFLPAAHETL